MAENHIMKKVNIALIIIFIINVVFLPNDTFLLKKASFILLILLNIPCLLDIRCRDDLFFLFFGFVFPIYTIIKSWLIMGDLSGNINGGFSGFMFLTYFIIKRYHIDFEEILMKVLMVLAWFMVLMALLDFAHIMPTKSNPLLMWFHRSSNAMIGRGSNHAFGIIYFMKSSPLLLLALAYQIKRNKPIQIAVAFAALLLSATRANILLAVVVLFGCYIYKDKNPKRRVILIVIGIAAVVYIAFGTGIIDKIVNAFIMKKDGDNVRSLTLKSILDVWKGEPLKFWLGSGYASGFYSEGRDEFVTTVELSYWNLLRRIGFTSFLVLMYMYLKPLKLFRSEALICIGYIAYLAVAYVDPVLYSSTGITAVLYMYYLLYLKNENAASALPEYQFKGTGEIIA